MQRSPRRGVRGVPGDLRRRVREEATRLLGFDVLRPGQEDAMVAVLSGRDTLAVMPTGSGKSAIYQLGGALIDGSTVVVSPLIALQKDQIDGMAEQLGGAVQVNSSLGRAERRHALDEVRRRDVEFLFLAPEQLANDESHEAVLAAQPTLFVVDEAHVISSWGHDFRPDYLALGSVVESLGHPQVLALTATASPPVRHEIIDRLGLRDPAVVVAGFERTNIRLEVHTEPDRDAARAALVGRVAAASGTGIVYVATHTDAQELADALDRPARPAMAYHAGLPRAQRSAVQERFIGGPACVVVATTAFGMGIDAPHVRFVFHADAPESLDAYYQEMGRAGRDGAPAEGVIFHAQRGGERRRYQAGTGELAPELARRLAAAFAGESRRCRVERVAEAAEVPHHQRWAVIGRFQAAGALAIGRDGLARWTGALGVEEATATAVAAQHRDRDTDRTRAEMMTDYLDTRACRWRTLLAYLGEPVDGRCGHCDNDLAERTRDQTLSDVPFPLDSRVVHASWGPGRVIEYEDDTMTVLFDHAGYRRLSVALVVDRDLLHGTET
jgi:ATP-dependent DNA helicase RecQ